MSFHPPAYPYSRLESLRGLANQHDGGVIDCSIGTPVDPPPPFVLEILSRGEGVRGYPASAGSPAFREAAAGWLARRFNVEVAPEQLAACVGTKEFVATTAGYLHLRYPDRDTVLYPSVSYPTYAMGATLAGLRAVPVKMTNGRLDLNSIDPSDVARALLLWSNSPSNPTGYLDDLAVAATWGRDHQVLVASDECYCEFTWRGPATSILQSGLNGVVAVHSLSKRSNLAGARVGFFAGDPEIVEYLRAVRQHAGFMVPAPIQAVAVAAYGDDEHVTVQRERYLRRLQRLSSALGSRGIDAPMPEGTFYLWISRANVDGWDLARELAETAGLLASPGELYGVDGAPYVRVAVVQPDALIDLAARRLQPS